MDTKGKIERLNSLRNEMTHLWGSAFVVGGGAVAAILNSGSIKDFLIGIIGLSFTSIFLNAYFIRRNEVVKIVKMLEDE